MQSNFTTCLEYSYWKESQPSLKANFSDSCFTGSFHIPRWCLWIWLSLSSFTDPGWWMRIWSGHLSPGWDAGARLTVGIPSTLAAIQWTLPIHYLHWNCDISQRQSTRSIHSLKQLSEGKIPLLSWLGWHVGILGMREPLEGDHQVEGPSKWSHETNVTVYIYPHCGFDHPAPAVYINFGNF